MPTKPSLVVSATAALALSIGAVYVTACGDSTGESLFDAGDESDAAFDGQSSGFPVDDSGLDGSDFPDDDSSTPGVLTAVIRDFKAYDGNTKATNPDFENVPGDADRPAGAAAPYYGPWSEATAKYFPAAAYKIDIVLDTLGADGTPQYNTAAVFKSTTGRTATTHGKTFFDQWYHDTPNFNVVRKVPLVLTKGTNGVYSYDSKVSGLPGPPDDPQKGFWPIDDGSPYETKTDGFGNNGNAYHNYHFTVELRTKFKYRGNETFKFSGDDDVFVFINKKLVINIGGIHEAETKEVSLAAVAAEIGLTVGQEYTLDFFQAERHVVQSNLRIDTTLDLKPSTGPN